ncbi:hypothetical protein HR49_14485 [Lysinibacillus fusiformis]|jgi:hypothetical protein|nr:hypothetical protein HR49_14485 [Lysinibacillus fusiformis]KAB0442384.1 hypothetical protein CH314_13975 [Lysinibacillus fusiformis]
MHNHCAFFFVWDEVGLSWKAKVRIAPRRRNGKPRSFVQNSDSFYVKYKESVKFGENRFFRSKVSAGGE